MGLGATSLAAAKDPVRRSALPQGEASWHSGSLTRATITAPNGAITTRDAAEANVGMGAAKKIADEIALGVFHLRGWGIAHSVSIAGSNAALADFGASLDRGHLIPQSAKSAIQLGVAATVADQELSTQP